MDPFIASTEEVRMVLNCEAADETITVRYVKGKSAVSVTVDLTSDEEHSDWVSIELSKKSLGLLRQILARASKDLFGEDKEEEAKETETAAPDITAGPTTPAAKKQKS
jgi:hypothetical protein